MSTAIDRPNAKIQLLCLWCGPIAIIIWMVGFVFASGFIVPVPPGATAQEVAAIYNGNLTGIRVGLLLTMIGATMTAPFVAAISSQMQRVEGRYCPLSYTQLGLGMGGILLFIIPIMNMQTAAFRPDRDPELLLLANDLGWMPFVGVWTMAALQNIAVALCVFQDKKNEVFPRWLGYVNIYVAILYCPGSLLYFFKDGPFAWNGLFSWWLVVADFCIWFFLMFYIIRKAIIRQGVLAGEL